MQLHKALKRIRSFLTLFFFKKILRLASNRIKFIIYSKIYLIQRCFVNISIYSFEKILKTFELLLIVSGKSLKEACNTSKKIYRIGYHI